MILVNGHAQPVLGEQCLVFTGTGDYLKARSSSDLDFALPMKFDIDSDSTGNQCLVDKGTTSLPNNSDWLIRHYVPYATHGISFKVGGVVEEYGAPGNFPSTRTLFEIIEDSGDIVHLWDGVEKERIAYTTLPSTNSHTFTLGSYVGGAPTWGFVGKLYNFQIGSEVFDCNEGSGTTVTGSLGTVLDITGATWNPV